MVRGGLWVVVDGLDGIGKGEIERAIKEYEEKSGKAVFDTIAFSRAYGRLPELKDFFGRPTPHYDVLMTAEPTYSGIGKVIREEIISRNGRDYSTETQIELYANDGMVQMRTTTLPALENGLTVIQSRCRAATLAYQVHHFNLENPGKESEQIKKRILNHEGTKFQLNNAPDLLIIPTIANIEELKERLRKRGETSKEDNSIFEDIKFQEAIKPVFESSWLRDIFLGHGTKVAYLDAGLSKEETRRRALEIYGKFSHDKEIPDKYLTPHS